jgi:hypothetical protein
MIMDKTTPMKSKPLVDVTCKLGTKGCFKDGRCHALGNCENKITTNADRIRAMSDEELAEVLGNLVHCGGCPMRDNCKVDDLPCNNVMLEWLQQPAEE